jgi:hypothetical protein
MSVSLEDHLYCARARTSGPVEFIHRPQSKYVHDKLVKTFTKPEKTPGIEVESDHDSVVVTASSCIDLYRMGMRVHYALKAQDLQNNVSLGPI